MYVYNGIFCFAFFLISYFCFNFSLVIKLLITHLAFSIFVDGESFIQFLLFPI